MDGGAARVRLLQGDLDMERINQSSGLKPSNSVEAAATRKKAYERPLVIDWGSVAEMTGGVNALPGDIDDLDGSNPI